MKLRIVILTIVLLSSANAFISNDGFEISYQYEAKVMANMKDEEHYSSKYEIFAKIFAQHEKNYIKMRLDNVEYSAYIGNGTKNGNRVEPSESITTTMRLPFLIIMDDGSYTMKFHKNDEEFSVAMKQSIANMLQLDETCLTETTPNKIRSEFRQEKSGDYQECNVRYTVENRGDEYSVTKEFNPNDCQKISLETNLIPKIDCGSPFEFNNVIRRYRLSNSSMGLFIENILSTGTYRSYFEKYNVNVFQSIGKVSVNNKKPLKYNESDYVKIISTSSINMEKNMNKTRRALEIIVDYTSEMKIQLKDAIDQQEESVISLLDYMKNLDEKSLLKVYEGFPISFKGKCMTELFMQILPFVKTEDAVRAIRNFILKKDIDDSLAVLMLQNMYGMKVLQETVFVKELEDLIKDDSGLSENVKDAAILAFTMTLTDFVASVRNASVEKFDEYVKIFPKKLIDAKTYKEKLVLVNAIGNIQFNQILPTYDNIVKGEGLYSDLSPHLRAVAMLSGLQSVRTITDRFQEVALEDKFMYVFRNKSEHLELRLTALHVLMEIGKPRLWIELNWHMMNEENDEIRGLYHSSLKSFVESNDKCYTDRIGFVKQLLKIPPKYSIKKLSIFRELFDYLDSLEKMGSGTDLVIYGNLNKDKFETIYMEKIFSYKNTVFSKESIYVNLKLKNEYTEHVYLNMESLMTLPIDVLSIDVIIYKNNMAISAAVYNPIQAIEAIKDWYQSISESKNMWKLSRFNYFRTEGFADIGFPVITYLGSSTLRKLQSNIKNHKLNPKSFDLSFEQSDNTEHGIMVKNPLLDVWHGIRRMQKVDTVFDLKMKYHMLTKEFHLDWSTVKNDSRANGFKSISHTEVFVKGEGNEEILRRSCADCRNMETGDEVKKNFMIWEHDDENTGLLYQFKIFDCDKIGANRYISHFKDIFKENMQKINYKTIHSAVSNFWEYMTLITPGKTCGIGFSMQPSKTHPVNKVFIRLIHSAEEMVLNFDCGKNDEIVKLWSLSSVRNSSPEMENCIINIKESWNSMSQIKNVMVISFNRNLVDETVSFKISNQNTTSLESFHTIFQAEMKARMSSDSTGELTDMFEWNLNEKYISFMMNDGDSKRYNYDVVVEDLPNGIWKKFYMLINMNAADHYHVN